MDALLDEVESLEAILMDDVRVTRNAKSGTPELIETTVFPVVGDETEQQYVCVTLQVLPLPGYPDVSPDFKLLRPRGLDDQRLNAIKNACSAKLQESLGFPVVFDLIEVVRDNLTGSNLPSGQCVICLYGFSDGDEFTRTECFHYLHSYCLGRHLNALRRNYQEEYDKLPAWLQKTADPFHAACPVCRERITDEADSLKCAMPPAELQNAPEFKLTRELRELQDRMSSLFLQQKSRGAIIDVEAESGAVISIETEEEIRQRLQRKQMGENNVAGENVEASTFNPIGGVSGVAAETSETAEQKEATCSKSVPAANNTNFAPVLQQTQRISNDPTNNNYQHQHYNRRHHHYRGGRRHQQHQQQYRDRDRERFENHHPHHQQSNHAADAGGASGVGGGAGGSAPQTAKAGATSGKQAKSHAGGSFHSR